MPRGPKKHMKRLAAPNHWMLDKLTGVWAPKPSSGPHKTRECIPLVVLLRNRLKYALTYREVKMIVMQRCIKIDGKVRTDHCFPAGFQDVVSIEKTGENFRLLFDVKGRFTVHPVTKEEAQYKLCRVKRDQLGPKGVPFVVTHDGRTFRFPDPLIKVNDTVKVDLVNNKIVDFVKLEIGNVCSITGGRNLGRVGVVTHIEKHPGSFNIIHVKDAAGHQFATRMGNIFIIGKGVKPWISLPKGNGIKRSIVDVAKATAV